MTKIKKWQKGVLWVEVDLDLCIGAEACVEICPVNVYELVEGKVVAENIGECTECTQCQGVCPTNAILNHSAWT